jgi:UDP-N-acetylmuramoyl-tripeptide--D-alanyl-D-alanine ligase
MRTSLVFSPAELAQWSEGDWSQQPTVAITGVSNDSRSIQPGDLYVALRGPQWDGHDFARDAITRGAAAVMGERALLPDVPTLRVSDSARALTRIAAAHRDRCRATVIGITGSVGKTSVKEWIADLLATVHPVARTSGNWNNEVGLPLSLLRMHPEDTFGVFEVGMSHPGELHPLCTILRPDFGVLTPIGPAHLEHFTGMEGIAIEKSTLSAAVPPSGAIFLSIDDPWYPLLAAPVKGRIIRLSMRDDKVDYAGMRHQETLRVRERASGVEAVYPLPLPGPYIADNALRAIAVARELGVTVEQIQPAMASYQPPGMRWRRETIAGLTFINDAYNANPMSMRAALAAFRELPRGQGRWVVLGGMRELGAASEQEHQQLGTEVAAVEWEGIITVGALGQKIAEGAERAGRRCWQVADTDAAAAVLANHAAAGSWVLLKASRGEQVERVLDALRKEQE